MVTDHHERPAVSKNFLKHVAKGGAKSIPVVGGLIDEMIFGTLEGEAAEKEAAKVRDGLQGILAESHAQSATLAELLDRVTDAVVFSGQTRAILDSVVEALRDIDAKLPSPSVTQGIERYIEKQLRTLPITLAKLPSTSPLLLGRDGELEILDEAWADPNTNVVTFVAFGGVGKTALVNKWLSQMREHGFRGAERVYGWSFYSQGTSEDKQASGDEFIAAALTWFGDPDSRLGSPWDKGERLARLVREKRTLLILDGLEPLQYPPGEHQAPGEPGGRLRDPGVQSLLRELAVDNPGLCVVSTRLAVDDLKDFTETTVAKVDLDKLSDAAGAQLLSTLGVKGSPDELEQAARDFDGHALALTLLGNYLKVVHDGDVRKRGEVPALTTDAARGGHARRVMECYERWFADKPELSIPRMMGLFDRPAIGGAIEALRGKPPIENLTADLHDLSEADWKFALHTLRDVGLLSEPDANAPNTLDCHPLIREHFGDKVRNDHPEAWREGHNRLFEYFKGPGCAKELPDTIDEMAPLFAAVTHGCHAGRHQETLDDVSYRRIRRGEKAFSIHMLGAYGVELAALSGFFDPPWERPVHTLRDADGPWVLNAAGFYLRALGRLREAVEPVRASLEASRVQNDWRSAAAAAGNLSEIFLTLGEISQALDYAQRSLGLADQSGQILDRIVNRASLGNVLHQAGSMPQAGAAFREAEQMQKEFQPEYPILYSSQGFKYRDLLLDLGNHRDVYKRAAQTLEWAAARRLLLDIALDRLSLGRACLMAVQVEASSDFAEAADHLRQAIDGLRKAGTQHHLPRGLLARAEYYRVRGEREGGGDWFDQARRDVDEAMLIATRGQMRLHECDCHLEYARLHLAQARPPGPEDLGHPQKDEARKHFEKARKMVDEMGYHRRDKDLADIESKLP